MYVNNYLSYILNIIGKKYKFATLFSENFVFEVEGWL